MKKNEYYLVETIQPWVAVEKFASHPMEVTTNHKLFKCEEEAYEAFYEDCKLWERYDAKKFNDYFRNEQNGLIRMCQYVMVLGGTEFVGYTKLVKVELR